MRQKKYFYPRSPCGERLVPAVVEPIAKIFLSTFPLRGTSGLDCAVQAAACQISIHVPLAGNVVSTRPNVSTKAIFLSTFPLRGTSGDVAGVNYNFAISIHVPLAGNVLTAFSWSSSRQHFYPRSPCGERLVAGRTLSPSALFLSTFPLRGTSLPG